MSTQELLPCVKPLIRVETTIVKAVASTVKRVDDEMQFRFDVRFALTFVTVQGRRLSMLAGVP